MALAIECDRLIREGVIKNQSELAHYAQVTTARMTHIMWLTNLDPEIQEAILFLPRIKSGPDTVKEIEVRRIAQVMDWGVQRGRWHDLFATATSPVRRNELHGWNLIRGKVNHRFHFEGNRMTGFDFRISSVSLSMNPRPVRLRRTPSNFTNS
jgi:hypothetical protein